MSARQHNKDELTVPKLLEILRNVAKDIVLSPGRIWDTTKAAYKMTDEEWRTAMPKALHDDLLQQAQETATSVKGLQKVDLEVLVLERYKSMVLRGEAQ